jgi:hypothetical protein
LPNPNAVKIGMKIKFRRTLVRTRGGEMNAISVGIKARSIIDVIGAKEGFHKAIKTPALPSTHKKKRNFSDRP